MITKESLELYDGVNENQLVDTSALMAEVVVRIAKGDLELKEVLEPSSFSELEFDDEI